MNQKVNGKRNKKTKERSIKVNLILVILIIIVILSAIVFISRLKEENKININLSKQSKTSEELKEQETNTTDEVEKNSETEKTQESQKEEKYVQKNTSGSKTNISTKLKEEKNIDGLTISNINLTEKGGITTLLADVKNNTNTKTEEKYVRIQILDEEGNEIAKPLGVIDPIEANGTVKLNVSISIDVSNAYDFKIVNEPI